MLTGAQYLLIGFIALCAIIIWFGEKSVIVRMIAWLVIAAMLSLMRFVVLYLSEWVRGRHWQSISKRNW